MTDIAELTIEQRLAALEQRLAPSPLALVPPITVGSLGNVPAPGSQIAAQWAQDVTGLGVHRFATATARDAVYPPAVAGNGATCITLDTQTVWVSNGTTWQKLMNVGGLYYQMTMYHQPQGSNISFVAAMSNPQILVTINLPASPAGTLCDISANINVSQSAAGLGSSRAWFTATNASNQPPIAGCPMAEIEDRAQLSTTTIRLVGFQPPANTATPIHLTVQRLGTGGTASLVSTNYTCLSVVRYTP